MPIKISVLQCRKIVQSFLFVCLVLGLFLQLFIKDRCLLTSLIFYSSPPLLLALLAIFLYWKSPQKTLRILASACFLFSLMLLSRSWHSPVEVRQETSGSSKKVLLWNLARPNHPDLQVIKLLQYERPHLACFVEVGKLNQSAIEEYKQVLPSYRIQKLGNGMAIFVRNEIETTQVQSREFDWRSSYHILSLKHAGQKPLQVILCDIGPDVLNPRKIPLAALVQDASSERSIILGDFNTPHHSHWLEPLRQTHHLAFEEAGKGFIETWPFGLPLHCLDQVWLSKDVLIKSCRKEYFFGKDHVVISCEFLSLDFSASSLERRYRRSESN